MLKTFVTIPTNEQKTCSILDPAMNDAPLEFNSYAAAENERQGNGVSSSASIDDIPVWIEDIVRYQERRFDRNRTNSRRNSRERNTTPRQQERRGRKDFLPGIDEGRSFIRDDHGIEASSANTHLFPAFATGIPDTTSALSAVLPTLDPSQWPMAPYAMMGVGDPGILGMMGMAGFGQFGFVRGPETPMMANMMTPVREVIQLPSCVLYPPKPNAPMPTTRDKPPGCRTVFVGGLPESTTEEIIREIFSRCGEICTVRTSKKNFCHIRFEMESAVDSAIYISGYRVRIDDKGDGPNTGRLHVDYAQARDDQYEWECIQRASQREMRHRDRMEQERLRVPSPPPVIHYSDHEAVLLIEKLRGEESFQKAVQILITWLDRGESTKKNANQFYSMIQSTNSHVRRLMNEKAEYEEELNKARQLLGQRMQGILIQFNQIEKVFLAASHQKVWDHFTKPQRKNIDMWRKQTEEIKNAQLEEVLNEREEDEMELSDEDMPEASSKKQKTDFDINQQSDGQSSPDLMQGSEVVGLQEENDSLRCQLEAYRNEVEVLKVEGQQDKDSRDRQLKVLQQALQGMQQQLLGLSQQRLKDEDELNQLRSQVQNPSSSNQGEEGEKTDGNSEETLSPQATTSEITSTSGYRVTVTEKDARLIGLISTFLHVHPRGAGVDYIWSYLQQLDGSLQPRDVEALMLKFPTVFRQELSGVGATLERRWNFTGFVLPGATSAP